MVFYIVVESPFHDVTHVANESAEQNENHRQLREK